MNSLVDRVFRALTSWKRLNSSHGGAEGLDETQLYSTTSPASTPPPPNGHAGFAGIIWSSSVISNQSSRPNLNNGASTNPATLGADVLGGGGGGLIADELIDLTQYPTAANTTPTSTDSTPNPNQSSHFYFSVNNNSTNSESQSVSSPSTQMSNNHHHQSTASETNILRFSFINPPTTSSSNPPHNQHNRNYRHSHHLRHHRTRSSNSSGRQNSATESTSSASSSVSDETSDMFASSLGSLKRRERNLLAACCSIFCIAILGLSLVETRWFYLNGGGCNVNYIGVAYFFAPGPLQTTLEYSKVAKADIVVYTFVLPSGYELKNCANSEIMVIMRTIIAFIFLAILSSSLALVLDTCGHMHPASLKLVRRHAIFHILTCVFCLAINGLCFWASERIDEQQVETRSRRGKRVDVTFDVSYYLIVLSSGLSILATAFTLVRRYSSDDDEQLERLLDEYTSTAGSSGFDEPLLHLERSLPAVTMNSPTHLSPPCEPPPPPPPFPPSSQPRNYSHSTGNNSEQAPPPPPPHALLLNSQVYQPVVTATSSTTISSVAAQNEPPPPYDPAPAFA